MPRSEVEARFTEISGLKSGTLIAEVRVAELSADIHGVVSVRVRGQFSPRDLTEILRSSLRREV
jgi:hypothetical protein